MKDINKVVIGFYLNEGVMLDAYWFLKEFSDIEEGNDILEKTKYHVLWYDNFWDEIKEDNYCQSIENDFMESFFAPGCCLKEAIDILTRDILFKDKNKKDVSVSELLYRLTYYDSEFENAKQRFINCIRENNSDMDIVNLGKEKERIREEKGLKGKNGIYNYD